MGVIISSLTRPLKSFNIENRAQKILNRQKPISSPSFRSTADLLELAREANPNFMKNHYKKDEKLYGRLKHIFVSSHIQRVGPPHEISEKPLPNCRITEKEFDYGFWEPTEVPIGRCHLKTALQLITDHLTEPERHSVGSIAAQYQLEPKDIENILEYYRVYQVMKKDATSEISDTRDNMNEKIGDK